MNFSEYATSVFSNHEFDCISIRRYGGLALCFLGWMLNSGSSYYDNFGWNPC